MIKKTFLPLVQSLREEGGQALVMAALVLVLFLGLVGFVVDTGHLYYSYQELQSSTNAAAMAAANGLDTSYALAEYQGAEYSAAPASLTKQYGYTAGAGNNAYSNLNVTNLTITPGCVGSNVPMAANVPCEPISYGSSGSSTANAVQISQTIKVQTYFAPFLGIPYVTLTARSAALMRGTPAPYNIALILDTTGSMQEQDATCSMTQLQCAENGMLDFLRYINPCARVGGCIGTTDNHTNYTNGFDRVALFAFPNGQTNAILNDYCAGAHNGYPQDERVPEPTRNISYPNAIPYVLPAIGGSTAPLDYYYNGITGYTGPWYNQTPVYGTLGTYEVTYEVTHNLGDANGFMTYYQLAGATAVNGAFPLDPSSDLVKALGGGTNCPGIQAPYLDGTYYPSVIYQAQSFLTAEQSAYPGSQNVMIILGDGDENVNYDWLMEPDAQQNVYAMVSPPSTLDGGLAWSNGLTPTGYDWDSRKEVTPAPSAASNYYPSWDNDCGQAVLAAAYAKDSGTKIYVVAYGSPTNGSSTSSRTTPYQNLIYDQQHPSANEGCPTDITGIPLTYDGVLNKNITLNVTNPDGSTRTNSAGISPCESMKDIASSDATFFSDSNITGKDTGCHGATNASYGSLAKIFQVIAGQLDHSRLIPNGVFTPSM